MQPDQIAAKLSKAQREALSWFGAAGSRRSRLTGDGRVSVRIETCHRLSSQGLLSAVIGSAGYDWSLTPLGQSVRAILAEREGVL